MLNPLSRVFFVIGDGFGLKRKVLDYVGGPFTLYPPQRPCEKEKSLGGIGNSVFFGMNMGDEGMVT